MNIQEIERMFIEGGEDLKNIDLETDDRKAMDERIAFQELGEVINDIFSSDDPDYYIEEYWKELLDLRNRLERPIEEYKCQDDDCVNYHRSINSAIEQVFERLGLEKLTELLYEKENLRNALSALELGSSMQMDWGEIVDLPLDDEEESLQLKELQEASSKICLERGEALDHLIDFMYYDEVSPNEETNKSIKIVNDWLECQGERIPENLLEFSQDLRGLTGLHESDEDELEIMKAIKLVLEEIEKREEG